MSRAVDPENLKKEDIRYLQDRPWMIDNFRRQGYVDQMDAVLDGQIKRDSPEDQTRVHTDDMRLGTQAPQQIDPRANGVTGDDEEVDDDYESWSKADLEAEIQTRNDEDGRETKISASGTKAELAARLHEDDNAEVSA